MIKAYYTARPFTCSVHPAVRWIVGNSPGSCANNIYSPGSDKLTEVQLYMSTSFQPGSWVIRAFSDVEKPFLFSNLVNKAAKSDNKKDFSMSENAQICSRTNRL